MDQYRVYFMPDAIKDLEDIYLYIVDQSGFPERAWNYMERLKFKCQELKTFPIRGQLRSDLMDGVRIYSLDNKAVAAFLVGETNLTVQILNVFYGGRDYEALFDS